MDKPVPDGRDFDLPIPPAEVKYWPNEYEPAQPGGHTKYGPKIDSQVEDSRISELVRFLVSTFKKVKK